MPPTVSLSRSSNGYARVRLQGHFSHPHWVAFLFSGLSNLKVSVVTGRAVRAADFSWDAQFDLDFDRSMTDPDTVDYLTLAQQEASRQIESLQLSHFQLTRRVDQGLDILLEGPDQIGFLGRILIKVSMLGLFPTEMEIDTVGGRIKDRLVFRGVGGVPPSESTRELVETMLRGLLATD